MLVDNVNSLIIVAISLILYHAVIPVDLRVRFILLISLVMFYIFSPMGLIAALLIGTSNFLFTKDLEKRSERKKLFLLLYVFINVLFLIIFKYGLLSYVMKLDTYVLLGVSYYTFESLSTVIDVYYKRINFKEVKYLDFLLFISYFPKIAQGPIERESLFVKQLAPLRDKVFSYEEIKSGLFLILYGFFLKFTISDTLGEYSLPVFDNIYKQNIVKLYFAAVVFTFQLYADFGGYTKIAIGVSRVLGIKITDNFNNPFVSVSIQEFWRRWHITLSNWMRDYIFMPLAIKTRNYGVKGMIFSSVVTFFLVGLWHGSNVSMLIFGLYHGILVGISSVTLNKRNQYLRRKGLLGSSVVKYYRIFVTFNLVAIGLIFFNLHNLSEIYHVFEMLGNMNVLGLFQGNYIWSQLEISRGQFKEVIGCILCIEFMSFYSRHPLKFKFFEKVTILRWSVYFVLLWGVLLFGEVGKQQFIYVDF